MRPYWSGSDKYTRVRWLISNLVIIVMVVLSIKLSVWNEPGRTIYQGGQIYGEYTGWEEVGRVFPEKGSARIIDLDTGRSFNVVRLGGTLHADVEPASAADTGIIKNIYGGAWSWRRRAALITVDGRRYFACSINGMPHGAGRIRDNNFPGHFCVHFRGSKLHINRREDPAHRMMVFKAAGKVDEMMVANGPGGAVQTFFTALGQGDLGILSRVAHFNSPGQLSELLDLSRRVKSVSLNSIREEKDGTVEVSLDAGFEGSSKSYHKEGVVKMSYDAYLGWQVQYSSVYPLLIPGEGRIVLSERLEIEDIEEKLGY